MLPGFAPCAKGIRLRTTILLALAASAALAAGADFPEVEPNEFKHQAAAVTLVPGDALVGNSTGSSTTAGGASLDIFKVKSAAVAPGIYEYRLVLTTTGTAGHVGSIRGLDQTAGVIGTTDVTVQTSTTSTTPQRYVQWYGFGKQEQIFYRVVGTASTTADYRATLDRAPVTPTNLGNFTPGAITFSTVGQGHDTDTDMWLYDANLNAIVDGGNDDEFNGMGLQSKLTRTLGPGTYYLALSMYNLANNLVSPMDDDFRNGNVLDFPDALVEQLTTTGVNCAFTVTDPSGSHPFSATKNNPYEVLWFKFTVTGFVIPHDNVGVLPSPGGVISGSDAAVNISDDSYWELRPGVVFSSAQDPCAVEFVGHCPAATPSQLEILVESFASTGGIRQTIQAYNYGSSSFVTVGSPGILPFSGADGVVIQALTPAQNIKTTSIPPNEMRARLSFRATSAVFAFPWKVKLDQVVWRYTP
jgi:hypothetical protein